MVVLLWVVASGCGKDASGSAQPTPPHLARSAPSSIQYSAEGPPPGAEDSDEGAVTADEIASDPPPPPRIAGPVGVFLGVRDVFGSQRAGGMTHGGIDLLLDPELQDGLLAPCAGSVQSIGDGRVVIDCWRSWTVLLVPVAVVSVKEGATLAFHQAIGQFDPQAGFLHFEVRWNARVVDPAPFLDDEFGPTAVPPPVQRQPPAGSAAPTPIPPDGTPALSSPTTAIPPPTAAKPQTTPTRTSTPVPPTATAKPTPRRVAATPTPIPILQ